MNLSEVNKGRRNDKRASGADRLERAFSHNQYVFCGDGERLWILAIKRYFRVFT